MNKPLAFASPAITFLALTAVAVLLALTGCEDQRRPSTQRPELEHMNLFHPGERPVSPVCIHDLRGSIADSGPVVAAVDVRRSMPLRNGAGVVSVTEDGSVESHIGTERFAYRYLGTTKSGIAVLQTLESSDDGSGRFQDLVFVRVDKDRFLLDGKWADREILRSVGVATLGDRVDAKVAIKEDHVTATDAATGKVIVDLQMPGT